MPEQNKTFDIIIAGGGLAGCLTALSLASLNNNGKPLSIAIVEANATQVDVVKNKADDLNKTCSNNSNVNNISFDSRVLALSHGSAQYLQQLGAWQYLQHAANPIETIHISDRSKYGKARIYAKQHQVNALGYVAEMQAIGQALQQALTQYENITWFTSNKINHIQWQQESVNVELLSGQLLSASLLLACDGAQSICRQLAQIKNNAKSYQQSAVIANVEMQKPHNNVAFERFTEHGPIAMLPLTHNRCSLVWTMPPEQAATFENLSDDDFAIALNHAFGYWLGGVKHVGKRVTYPLILLQAAENVYHRMALIGNASHTIHPIAGQGFNLGLRDIQTLASLIEKQLLTFEHANQQVNIGSLALLNEYAKQRSKDQQQIIQLTDTLVTLFSNDLFPMVIGRNIGLKGLNYLKSLKQAFVNKTMGY